MTALKIGIVLAAGKGTRMKSDLPKVLHPLLGKPMLRRVLESFSGLGLSQVILIVGHQAQAVQEAVATWNLPYQVTCVVQEPQLGTGHALMQVLPVLPQSTQAQVLITCGDMPLVPAHRYESLMENQVQSDRAATMAAVHFANPTGYGRVLTLDGAFTRIVEEKDASVEEKQVTLGNAGIYAVDWPRFSACFEKLGQNNAQGEFYLTDVLEILAQEGATHHEHWVSVDVWPHEAEVIGINSRAHLAEATQTLSMWACESLMADGVTVITPQSQTIAPEVSIGPDSVLHPGCYLEGAVSIGSRCDIGPHTTMRGQITVGNQSRIVSSYLDIAVTVADNSYIGPYAHLRDNAKIGPSTRIGNFVEVKDASVGERSAAAHLCYIGNAQVGADVNMGAGSIIANYDPIRDLKHTTVIEDAAKIGCNSVLVSPVCIGEGACVAAGSVITDSVEADSLAIARGRQASLPHWVSQTKQGLVK